MCFFACNGAISKKPCLDHQEIRKGNKKTILPSAYLIHSSPKLFKTPRKAGLFVCSFTIELNTSLYKHLSDGLSMIHLYLLHSK